MCRICASLALFLDQPSEVMGLSTSLSGCSTPHGEIRETGQGCGDHGFGKLETTDPQSETATSICQAERCHPNPPLIPAPKHLLRLQELDWVQCELCGEEQRQGCGFRITAPNKGDTTDASQDPAMVAKGDKEED